MASIPSELEAAIMALTLEEKAELVRLLIASLEEGAALGGGADQPMPEWHRQVLEGRVQSREPETDVDWADLKDDLRNRSDE